MLPIGARAALKMTFKPDSHHQAFPGMINGGIIGTLLDCHGNWTAAVAIMDDQGLDEPPCTVTATYDVQLRRPTPADAELTVTSQVVELSEDRAKIAMTLEAEGKGLCQGEWLVCCGEGRASCLSSLVVTSWSTPALLKSSYLKSCEGRFSMPCTL